MVVIAGYVAGITVRDRAAVRVGVPYARTAAVFLGGPFDLIARRRNPPDKITRQVLNRERCGIWPLNGTTDGSHDAFPPFLKIYLPGPIVFLMHINTLNVVYRHIV